MPALAILPLLLMQVGVDPSQGAIPGIPEELRDRKPRTNAAPAPKPTRLTRCLAHSARDPEEALAEALDWRKTARGNDRVAAAQCQGFALVGLSRFAEAQSVFASARSELAGDPAWSARLGAMGANAALAAGDAASALGLGTAALGDARMANDTELVGGIERDRARALVSLNRLPEAVEALDQARIADPGNPQGWLLGATLARRMGDLDTAATQIAKAAELAPRDPEVGLEAGVIAALAGRDEDAVKSFQSVVDVAPESTFAAQARTYLEQLQP